MAPTGRHTGRDRRRAEPLSRASGSLQALASAASAAALLGLAEVGTVALVAGLLVLQVLLVVSLLVLLDGPAAAGMLVIAAAATVGADAVVLLDDGRVAGLAGVAALSLVAGLLHQLARRHRTRVTESLADTMLLVVLSSCAACLPAALQLTHGPASVRSGLAAAGTALLVGRLTDSVVRRPVVTVGTTRGWPGLVTGLVAGAAAGVLVSASGWSAGRAAAVGLVAAAVAVVGDLLVELVRAELPEVGVAVRRRTALRAVGVLLPLAVLGPVVLLAVRLLPA